MKIRFLLILLLMASGCSQIPRDLHPWQSYGNAFSFQVDTTKWPTIEAKYLWRVAPEHITEATDLLKESDFVEITLEKAKRMCSSAKFDLSGKLRPFLIRGVSYGKPAYSIVKIDPAADWIYIFQATCTGEFYMPGVRYAPVAAPVVILLERQPIRVISCANIGGDAIFRGMDDILKWEE